MSRLLVSLVGLVLCVSCGKLPGYMVNETSQDFTQSGVTNDKVDILFVVDNSGSMQDNQTNLSNSFTSFIDQFSTRNLKFQIGVISTDAYRVNFTTPTNYNFHSATTGYWNCSSYGTPSDCPFLGILNSGVGSLLAKTGNSKIITPSTTNYVNQFKQNVQLGIKGSGAEQGLVSTMVALSPAMNQVGAFNRDFMRDGAFLAVILVSDEDEGNTPMDSTYIRSISAAAKNARLDQFVNFMKGLKEDSRMVRFDAIVDPTGSACGGTSQDGTTYEEAATRLNGKIIPVCNDFGTSMAQIGGDILSAATRFKLRQPPQGDITVYADGVLVPQDNTNGWVYLPDTMEIEFRGTAVPSVGQKIQLVYVPGAPA